MLAPVTCYVEHVGQGDYVRKLHCADMYVPRKLQSGVVPAHETQHSSPRKDSVPAMCSPFSALCPIEGRASMQRGDTMCVDPQDSAALHIHSTFISGSAENTFVHTYTINTTTRAHALNGLGSAVIAVQHSALGQSVYVHEYTLQVPRLTCLVLPAVTGTYVHTYAIPQCMSSHGLHALVLLLL